MRKKRLVLNLLYWTVVLLGIIFLLSSCATQKRCLEKFGKADTIRVTNTVYKDTIIRVTINKLPPLYRSAPINDTLRVRYGAVKVTTWVRDSTIYQIVSSVDSTYKVKLDSAIKVITEKNTVIQTYKEKYVPKWIGTLAGVGGLVIGAFLLWFISKFITWKPFTLFGLKK